MAKKFILVLVACLWILIGTNAWADLVFGDYTYTEDGGKITITEYTSSSGDVVIPDTIDGMPVVIIGEDAFSYNDDVTSVTIPDSVTTIEKDAFQNCDGLTVAIIGNGVTSIGDSAFKYCDDLKSVSLGNSVTTIGPYAFYDTALISLTIPDSVTIIGENAFRYCDVLAKVSLGNSVASIGDGAFHRSYFLTNISIPASVTSIGSYAFSDSESLSIACFMGDAPTIGSYAFDDTAEDFNICYTPDATETFATPTWEGYPAGMCVDSDDDGVIDAEDNCPDVANPDQENADVATETAIFGDVCDADTVYGYIYESGVVLENVTVRIYKPSCGGDIELDSATTDSKGYYSFGNLGVGWRTLAPELSGYTFAQEADYSKMPQTVITSHDFTATTIPAP